MVSRNEDKVDFDKLAKQLNDAVEYEAQYWRENAAKFRAVEQKVATYEEFRDIVQASHLKPLEKDDKIQSVFKQPWNSSADGKTKSTSSSKDEFVPKTESNRLPRSGNEFALKWRRLKSDSHSKYDLLMMLGSYRLAEIFKCEISDGLLSDIIAVLLDNCIAADVIHVVGVLASLSTAGRFQLTLEFLSAAEKATCIQLFSRIEELLDGEQLIEMDIDGVRKQLQAIKHKYVPVR